MLHDSVRMFSYRIWLAWISGLLLWSVPRFNRDAFWGGHPLNDAAGYIAYVQFFRGEPLSYALYPAANWRPGVPFLASWLPFEPLTSINIINALLLIGCLVVHYAVLKRLAVPQDRLRVFMWLYVFSFPNFYYATIGYVEPGVLLLLHLGVLLMLRQNWFLLWGLLGLGVLFKEGIVVLMPVVGWWLRCVKSKVAALLWGITSIGLVLGVSVWIRNAAPLTSDWNPGFWILDSGVFIRNVTSWRAWGSGILTLAPMLIWGFYQLRIRNAQLPSVHQNLAKALALGVLGALLMYGFAFGTAAPDGRLLWAAYPFGWGILALLEWPGES